VGPSARKLDGNYALSIETCFVADRGVDVMKSQRRRASLAHWMFRDKGDTGANWPHLFLWKIVGRLRAMATHRLRPTVDGHID